MLKGIDPRLNAETLGCLRAMGHGDMLIIADTNFPAETVSRSTILGHPLKMENLTAAQAVEAILSLLPLDTFVPDFAARMQVVGDPAQIPAVQAEVQAWSAGLLSIFRLKLKVLGSLSTPPQSVLVVFNHVSWLKCPLIAPLSSPLARRDEES